MTSFQVGHTSPEQPNSFTAKCSSKRHEKLQPYVHLGWILQSSKLGCYLLEATILQVTTDHHVPRFNISCPLFYLTFWQPSYNHFFLKLFSSWISKVSARHPCRFPFLFVFPSLCSHVLLHPRLDIQHSHILSYNLLCLLNK